MKRIISFMLVVMMTVVMVGCGKNQESGSESKVDKGATASGETKRVMNETGMPIVNEPYTLSIATRIKDGSGDPGELKLYKDLTEKTGVSIDWMTTPESVWKEKKSLMFASNKLPDAFFGNWILDDSDVLTYGSQGLLIPLENLIEKYAPNLQAIFTKYPEYKAMITAQDGHIYGLPAFDDGIVTSTTAPMYINKKWLDQLGMEVPTTTDELYTVLKAFKENDMNGNGDKNDEIPLTFKDAIYDIGGSFGEVISNRSFIGLKDDQVYYVPETESYKEAIKYFNKLYAEGLIDQEGFSQDSKSVKAKKKSEERILGLFQGWRSVEWKLSDDDDEYMPIGPFAGPKGDKLWPERINGIKSKGAFAITAECKNPEIAMRWVDEMYEDDFAIQASLSLFIGTHIEKDENNNFKTILKGTKENKANLLPSGNERISAMTRDNGKRLLEMPSYMVEKQELDQLYKDYYPAQTYPNVYFSLEENEQLAILNTDLVEFTKEKYAKWVVKGGIEEEWDSYIAKLYEMGLKDMIRIHQDAYDRFLSVK